jgi:hypothetical protein
MPTGLNPCTVAEAGPIMARAMGFSWEQDRSEVVDYINRFRLLVFTDYDKFKLFDDSFHCICVQTFTSECGETYQGFSLPNNILGVEAIYSYGVPLRLRSRWRESHTGLGVHSLGRVEAVLMAEVFATERDLKSATKIKLFTEHEKDNGKRVHIEVIDVSDRQRRVEFTLMHDGWAVSPVKIKKILSVSLPPGRSGSVLIAQQDGYELSLYDPWETVPAYRRMKLKDDCCKTTVLVQGTKNPKQKVYFDHDIVEIGNDLIIEEAGRYFKFGESTSDQKELQTAQYHRAEMERLLKGEIARHRGNSIQDGSPFKGGRITAVKTLPGYTR